MGTHVRVGMWQGHNKYIEGSIRTAVLCVQNWMRKVEYLAFEKLSKRINKGVKNRKNSLKLNYNVEQMLNNNDQILLETLWICQKGWMQLQPNPNRTYQEKEA